MSIRVDSSPLITGAVVVGDPGLGVLAEQVPSTGEHGPGIASTWLGPAEAGKEVRVLITQWPEVGSLFVWEDTSFEYNGLGGTAYAQLYVDGQPVDTPKPVAFAVGATAAVSPSRGRYAVSGHPPAVLQGDAQAIAPQSGHVQATGYSPTVEQTPSVRPQAGRIAAHGYAPTIGQAQTIAPTRAQTVVSGHAPIVVKGVRVDPQTGRVEWAGHAPVIAQGGARSVAPVAGHVRARGWAPVVTAGVTPDTLPIDAYIAAYLNPPDAGQATHGNDYLRLGERFARRRGLV